MSDNSTEDQKGAEKKHLIRTPGPWDAVMHEDGDRLIAIQAPSGDVLLCTGDGEQAWGFISPNDLAILTAAPDLLDALRSYVTGGCDCANCLAAQAAINKAEGSA